MLVTLSVPMYAPIQSAIYVAKKSANAFPERVFPNDADLAGFFVNIGISPPFDGVKALSGCRSSLIRYVKRFLNIVAVLVCSVDGYFSAHLSALLLVKMPGLVIRDPAYNRHGIVDNKPCAYLLAGHTLFYPASYGNFGNAEHLHDICCSQFD